jgi:outer membrane receptor protein involved in Fe transport
LSLRLAALLTVCLPLAAAENPAEVMELGRIDVIGTTPLPGLGTPVENVPANVQVFTSRDLARRRAPTLPSFLERDAASLTINSAQGNMFQPDVSYRGFTASPLLGVPQGLSVFQDGVRINEPFGDVVNWDLIPAAAIASIQLIPGSTPAFGPNTLGGAIAVYTKSGSQFPGGAVETHGGSFGRRALQFEQGGYRGEWDYFFTGNFLDEHGWAAHNPSRVRQFFAKVGFQTERTDIDVSLTAADNALNGAQTLPLSFLDDIRQPYTYPDRYANRLGLLSVKASHFLASDMLLGATAYARKFRNENFASNVNTDFSAPGDLEATNDIAVVDQHSQGLGAQLTIRNLVLGASGDWGRARFTRRTQPARFTSSRGTQALGEFETTTDATSTGAHYGVFASHSFSPAEHWTVTASARQNFAFVRIEPELGSHRFARPGAALGINFNPAPGFTAYASQSTSMRAPTPIELTCADPAAPCRLPNNFITDPPLRPVVSRTTEAGARGKWGEGSSWSAAAYRTVLDDDIYFARSGGATNAGYFRNIGRTCREGVELSATVRHGPVEVAARYGYVRATFQDGKRIPSIPASTVKLRAEYGLDPASIGVNVVATGSTYARGDEANRDIHGRIPGYAIVNLTSRWRVTRDVELFALIDNLLDQRYANFGVLGENFFIGPGRTYAGGAHAAEQFRGPGIPRGAWIGVRFVWL